MLKKKDMHERIVHRMKISLGHLKKVLEMVENSEHCVDILHQSQAVQKALKETDNLILENHLKNCTTDAIKHGNEETAIKEIISVFKKKNI